MEPIHSQLDSYLSSTHPEAILELDLSLFCDQALTQMLDEDTQAKLEQEGEESPTCLKIIEILTLKAISKQKDAFVCGFIVSDVLKSRHWRSKVFTKRLSAGFLSKLAIKIIELKDDLESYQHRCLLADILETLLSILYSFHRKTFETTLNVLTEALLEVEAPLQIDLLLRALISFLENLDEEPKIKSFHKYVGSILEAALQAFTV